MDCLVCAQPLSPQMGRCPVCQFPLLRVPGAVRERSLLCRDLAEAYRRRLLRGLRLSVASYTWEPAGSRLALREKREIPLLSVDRLRPGEICWLEQPFARVPVRKPIALEFTLRTAEGGYRLLRLRFAPPQAVDFWQVGVGLAPGLRAVAYLRCGGEIRSSEPFPLLTD